MPYDAQAVGIHADDDRALTAAERRRRRQARERRKLRPHAVERQVLDLAEAARVAPEDTRYPTGTVPASKRMTNGPTVPGGMNARARLTYPIVCASASAMSVPG